MDRSDDNSQLIHPQYMHNSSESKRSHDATLLTPSTDDLRPEKRWRLDNEEGQGLTTGIDGSHAPHRSDALDIPAGREGPEPVVANFRIGESHTQAQVLSPADVRQGNSILQNARGVTISGNPNFHNIGHNIGSVTNIYGGGTDGLHNLNGFISFDAQFDSSAQDPDRQCHPGTRQNVLKRLRDWVDNPKSTERIAWLYGPAGAGKSAIAQTIARSYARPKVAGTFFFFRSDVNRNDGNRLFTTLAYQLAFSMPEIREYITNSLSERPDLPRADVETQFDQLFTRPFRVLNVDSTKQLYPVVHAIIDIVKKYQKLAPVIIIDGVDECTNENLQRRFLKIIGDAVKDDYFLLRFLIVSRPEVHIEQTIRRFKTPILTIDLAKLDDANRDIEKYLVDEFSRIASEQGLDPTWPGPDIICDIVYKSSGNFIFASLVIRFVGDPYCFAKTQLDIVLNIKPPKTMSPFAVLDQLFFEILTRVPDQDFLKRYLALLTARISVSGGYGDLHKDDAVLMHVSEDELHANLRRMRSLLEFKPFIDVHHKSFLDFLHDSSRSGQYHICKQHGIRGYLEVFVDSLVRYTYALIEQPDHNNTPHFNPRFRVNIEAFPTKIKLPVDEWPEVIQPLLDLQNKLLQLPTFASTWHLLPCDKCTVFHLLRELLHLSLYFIRQPSNASTRSILDDRKDRGVVSSTTIKIETKIKGNDLDSILTSLLAHLPEIMENWSPNEEAMKLMSAILHFDSAEVARSVRFVSDAQKLVDLLVYIILANNALSSIHPDAMRKAGLLALEIFTRAPILPMFCFSNRNYTSFCYIWWDKTIPIQILAQTIFASLILDRYYIVSMSRGYGAGLDSVFFHGDGQGNHSSMTMAVWRQTKILTSATVRQMMLELAKVIQNFHSLGVVLHGRFGSDNVFLDLDFRPKIRCWCSISRFPLDQRWKGMFSPEENIFCFGCIFYELFSGVDTRPLFSSKERRHFIPQGRSGTGIPDYAWQLIQNCCAEDPGSRPTIDEVVEQMGSWKIE